MKTTMTNILKSKITLIIFAIMTIAFMGVYQGFTSTFFGTNHVVQYVLTFFIGPFLVAFLASYRPKNKDIEFDPYNNCTLVAVLSMYFQPILRNFNELIFNQFKLDNLFSFILDAILVISVLIFLLKERNISFRGKKIATISMVLVSLVYLLSFSIIKRNIPVLIVSVIWGIVTLPILSFNKVNDNKPLVKLTKEPRIKRSFSPDQIRIGKYSTVAMCFLSYVAFFLAAMMVYFNREDTSYTLGAFILGTAISIVLVCLELTFISILIGQNKISVTKIVSIHLGMAFFVTSYYWNLIDAIENTLDSEAFMAVLVELLYAFYYLPISISIILFGYSNKVTLRKKITLLLLCVLPISYISGLFSVYSIIFMLIMVVITIVSITDKFDSSLNNKIITNAALYSEALTEDEETDIFDNDDDYNEDDPITNQDMINSFAEDDDIDDDDY